MKKPSIALALLLATTSLHAQERPTLSYTFEEGRGTTTKDGGTGNVTLEIGSGMGWSQPGAGVNGGTAIGCVADGDIALRNAHPIKDIPEVAAITITGWYQLGKETPSDVVLLDLQSAGGDGLLLRLNTKAGGDSNGPRQATLALLRTGSAPATMHSLWNDAFARPDTWTFFAVSVNPSKNKVIWHRWTPGLDSVVEEQFWLSEDFGENMLLPGPPECLVIGSSAEMKAPLPPGMSLDNVHFYLFGEGEPGPLNKAQVEIIREDDLVPATPHG
jgi:hypothetical protein